MARNPKLIFKNKPTFSVRAHATMRIHGDGKRKRIEIGFRIPPGIEEHLYRYLSEKRKSRS